MKKNTYCILGAYGIIGRVITHDLFETTDGKIIVAGHDAKQTKKFAASFKNSRVAAAAIDVRNTKRLVKLIRSCDIVINATQYIWNLSVMRACKLAKKPYIDLGGLFHITKEQLKLNRQFKKARVLAVIGCGATPGITNVMAAYGASFFERVTDIHIKFSSRDYTKYTQPFLLPYSAQTILDEFSMKAATFVSGRLKMITPFSDREFEYFPAPVGQSLCGSMLHSELATFPKTFKSKGIRNCSFKASFTEDFTKFIELLVHLGFARSPYRTWTVEFLNKFLPDPKMRIKDLEILRVTLIGIKNGRKKKIIVDCRTPSNVHWNVAAGTVDTAVPASIIAQMITCGEITNIGVLPPELCISPKIFFAELKKRNMRITVHHD